MKATFYAPGLLDLTLTIKVGGSWTAITFEGGYKSGYGTRWATFITEDPVLSKIIENSQYFRKGIVKKEREVESKETKDANK